MKKQITRISVFQSSKLIAAMYAPFGLIYSLIGLGMLIFAEGGTQLAGFILLLGPVWMSIMGFLGAAFFAVVYNFLAGHLGGVEFEVKDIPGEDVDELGY